MANEYINRVNEQINRPPSTREDFRSGLEQFKGISVDCFTKRALLLGAQNQEDIALPIEEFDKRLGIMWQGFNPRAASHHIDVLLRYIDISKGVLISPESEFTTTNTLEALQAYLVHSQDPLRNTLINFRLLMPKAKRQLMALDRNSKYYKYQAETSEV